MLKALIRCRPVSNFFRHCERSAAIQAYYHFSGLPRYARNDENTRGGEGNRAT